jgi:hypothetical protein
LYVFIFVFLTVICFSAPPRAAGERGLCSEDPGWPMPVRSYSSLYHFVDSLPSMTKSVLLL